MKTRLLLINAYREDAEDKILPYRVWMETGGEASGLELEIREAKDVGPLPGEGEYEAAVLSGSHKMIAGRGEVEAGLIDFLRRNRRPLLGICYGHQILARAFGGRIEKGAVRHRGEETVRIETPDDLFAGFPETFPMRESHEEIVARDAGLDVHFRVLASSGPGSGLVEAIRHRGLPLWGVQFHPEKSGEWGNRLLANFSSIIKAFTDSEKLDP